MKITSPLHKALEIVHNIMYNVVYNISKTRNACMNYQNKCKYCRNQLEVNVKSSAGRRGQ